VVCRFHQLPCQFQLSRRSPPTSVLISLCEVTFAWKYTHAPRNQNHAQFYTDIAVPLALPDLLTHLSLEFLHRRILKI